MNREQDSRVRCFYLTLSCSRPVAGLTGWTETLSSDLVEARRLLPAHVQRTDHIIALASVGNWPEIRDEEIEVLAIGWWAEWQDDRERALYLPGRPGHLQRRLRDMHPSEWALRNEAESRRSVQRFIRGPRRLDTILEPELSTIYDDDGSATGDSPPSIC